MVSLLCEPYVVGVAGDALSGFKGAVILQKIRDAGRPECRMSEANSEPGGCYSDPRGNDFVVLPLNPMR
jgi:hypothetical protein